MGISVSGLTDAQLLGYNDVAIQLKNRYPTLQETLSGDNGIVGRIATMKSVFSDMSSKFSSGYSSDGGKTYTAIKEVIDNLEQVLADLETEADTIISECEARAKFYARLNENIITARNAVADKYEEKEYKSGWRLIENTVIAAENNKKSQQKSDVRYSITDCMVSY